MTTAHCPRCLRFTSPLRPHACPCDDFARRALHRYATALALALFVGGFGLLYVGTHIPDATLPAPRSGPETTTDAAVPPVAAQAQTGAPLGTSRPSPRPSAALDAVDAGAGDEDRSPASGAPQPPASSPPDTATATIRGRASWYAANGDVASVPGWRYGDTPYWAVVDRVADGRVYSVTVLVVGFCQCLVGTDSERVIDLSDGAFRQLAPLSVGLIRVTVEIAEQGPRVTPPATDLEEPE